MQQASQVLPGRSRVHLEAYNMIQNGTRAPHRCKQAGTPCGVGGGGAGKVVREGKGEMNHVMEEKRGGEEEGCVDTVIVQMWQPPQR